MKKDETAVERAVVEAVRRVCSKLPAWEEYVMVHHPAFRVGKKPFVIVGLHEDRKRATLSINLGRDMQHQLLDDERFSRTPYIGQHGWVTIARDALKDGELEALVFESWRRVANKTQLARFDDAPPAAAKPAAKEKRAR